MKTECVHENPYIAYSLHLIVRHCICRKVSHKNIFFPGSNPEELGPLLQGIGGRTLGNMNHQQLEPCGGGSSPPSTNLGGARTTTMSNPWHLLHAMRAMRIASQDPSTDLADNGDIPFREEPPGKENDSSLGVSRYIIHFGELKSSQTMGMRSFLLQSYKIWIKCFSLIGKYPGKGSETGVSFMSPLFWSQDCRLQRGLVFCRVSIVVLKAVSI